MKTFRKKENLTKKQGFKRSRISGKRDKKT